MNTPLPEPLYVTSLEEVLWGGLLVAITMAMHGFGMLAVLRVNHAVKYWFKKKTDIASGLVPVILASWMIMLVHLTEVAVWAGFFSWQDAFPSRSVSYYFSLNEYTTVGSNFNLPVHWRLLEGMIATTGLLTFAWSTGILLTLAQEFQSRQLASLHQQREARRARRQSRRTD